VRPAGRGPRTRKLSLLVAGFLVLLGALLLVGTLLRTHSPDDGLAATLQVHPHTFLATASLAFSTIGGPITTLAAYLLLQLRIFHRDRLTSPQRLTLLLICPGAQALETLAKLIVARPRPVLRAFPHPHSSSFPSGHSSAIMAITITALIYTRIRQLPHQRAIDVVGGLLVLGVGLSRIGLGVHHLSDVLAGWSISLLWAILILRVLRPPVFLTNAPDRSTIVT
jgi:membrane-associated phospholipid phosphatase